MSDNTDDLQVYIYRGKKGEQVPENVDKLIVEEGVQILPDKLCRKCLRLREVTLPKELIKIGVLAFSRCENLLEVKISSSVQFIGRAAFRHCELLKKVEFEISTIPPHQRLQTIGHGVFDDCHQLSRIKLPSSVTSIGQCCGFEGCRSLIEANLSTTGLATIPFRAFAKCSSLRTVSLPNTLERICDSAFWSCSELVTVVVLFGSRYLKIGSFCFEGCSRLCNIVLPAYSTTEAYSFRGCRRLHECYSEDRFRIVAGLKGRFLNLPLHRMCYDHSGTTAQELRKCIVEQQGGNWLLDMFGMTPFHILFSTADPSKELLDVLLESLPNQMLLWNDANDMRALDYLTCNWTDDTSTLLDTTLQKCMIDPLSRWGATSWMDTMQIKVQEALVADDKEQRKTLLNEAYSLLEDYENIEATSILEMAIWKWKLKSGWTKDGTKRQALDREECRCLSGSDVVIPRVAILLGILQTTCSAEVD